MAIVAAQIHAHASQLSNPMPTSTEPKIRLHNQEEWYWGTTRRTMVSASTIAPVPTKKKAQPSHQLELDG